MDPVPPAPEAPHVLLADDEPLVRTFLAAVLTDAGYRVTPVADGHQAVALLTDSALSFAAAILDCLLPGLSGPEVFALSRLRGCRAPILLVSGSSGPPSLPDPTADPAVRFLAKPFSIAELARAVADLLTLPSGAPG